MSIYFKRKAKPATANQPTAQSNNQSVSQTTRNVQSITNFDDDADADEETDQSINPSNRIALNKRPKGVGFSTVKPIKTSASQSSVQASSQPVNQSNPQLSKRSSKQSFDQYEPSYSAADIAALKQKSSYIVPEQSLNQSLNQSINQLSIVSDQTSNQHINDSSNQPILLDDDDDEVDDQQRRLIDQAKKQRAYARSNHSNDQSNNPPISHSISQDDASELHHQRDFIPLSNSTRPSKHRVDQSIDRFDRIVNRGTEYSTDNVYSQANSHPVNPSNTRKHHTVTIVDETDDMMEISSDDEPVNSGSTRPTAHLIDDNDVVIVEDESLLPNQSHVQSVNKSINHLANQPTKLSGTSSKHRTNDHSEISLLDDESDDEDDAWELEQLKASGIPSHRSISRSSNQLNQSIITDHDQSNTTSSQTANQSISQSMTPLQSLNYDHLYSSLMNQLHSLKNNQSSKRTTKQSLLAQKAQFELEQSINQSINQSTIEKLHYFQEVRSSMTRLADCLLERSIDIDCAFDEMVDNKQKRRADRVDRMSLYLNDMVDCLIDRSSDESAEPMVDEFGRDVGYSRSIDQSRRDAVFELVYQSIRSSVNLIARNPNPPIDRSFIQSIHPSTDSSISQSVNQSDNHSIEQHIRTNGWYLSDRLFELHEGYSTNLSDQISHFLLDVQQIFADVDDQYNPSTNQSTNQLFSRSSDLIKQLKDWKTRYPQSFQLVDADQSIKQSVKRLIEPLVKYECLLHYQCLDHSISQSPSSSYELNSQANNQAGNRPIDQSETQPGTPSDNQSNGHSINHSLGLGMFDWYRAICEHDFQSSKQSSDPSADRRFKGELLLVCLPFIQSVITCDFDPLDDHSINQTTVFIRELIDCVFDCFTDQQSIAALLQSIVQSIHQRLSDSADDGLDRLIKQHIKPMVDQSAINTLHCLIERHAKLIWTAGRFSSLFSQHLFSKTLAVGSLPSSVSEIQTFASKQITLLLSVLKRWSHASIDPSFTQSNTQSIYQSVKLITEICIMYGWFDSPSLNQARSILQSVSHFDVSLDQSAWLSDVQKHLDMFE